MRILVVDDESLARDRLAALIDELGEPYQLAGMAANGEESLEVIHQSGADLVLMDIRMPGMDGLQAARELAQMATPPAVIFTTAYEEHALQAFETQAIDYLLKPVRKERLRNSLVRAQRITLAQLDALAKTSDKPAPYLSVTYRGGVSRVFLDEVIYLRAESKYVTIRHTQGEHLIEESLKNLELRYPETFIRIHRNALVAKEALLGLEKDRAGVMQVRLRACDERLEVSRRHLPAVRQFMKHSA